MSSPQYVPTKPGQVTPSYSSPPRRRAGWLADRPGDFVEAGQPHGDRLGRPGPDQGYVYRLLSTFEGKVFIAKGESPTDMEAGVVAVALKRASLFGRAPVVYDLDVAFRLWGFLDEDPDAALLAVRQEKFSGVANPHHYGALRSVADAVPDETLRRTPREVAEQHRRNWRSLLDV